MSNRDPAVIGMDRDLLQGLACAAAALGLLLPRARRWVAVGLLLAISYVVSDRRVAGSLAIDALVFVPIVIGAVFVWWPPLIPVRPADD